MARQNYAECERRVLLSEGGYTNDPRDPGGPTNWGITLEDARLHWKRDATAEDVRAMPRSVAEEIYKSKYWDAFDCDNLPSGVDYAVFDYGVNSGIGRSSRVYKQYAHLPPVECVHAICDERLAFLKRLPTWEHFGVGWERRVASVRLYADRLASEAAGEAPEHHEATEGSAKAYDPEMAPETPQIATVAPQAAPSDAQSAPVVRQNEPPATLVAPQPKTHWWKPWAALGLGGAGSADWLDKANDWGAQLSITRDNLESLHATDALHWLIHNPAVLLPAVIIGCGAWLWEDHKKTKRLIEELKKCSPSLPPS